MQNSPERRTVKRKRLALALARGLASMLLNLWTKERPPWFALL